MEALGDEETAARGGAKPAEEASDKPSHQQKGLTQIYRIKKYDPALANTANHLEEEGLVILDLDEDQKVKLDNANEVHNQKDIKWSESISVNPQENKCTQTTDDVKDKENNRPTNANLLEWRKELEKVIVEHNQKLFPNDPLNPDPKIFHHLGLRSKEVSVGADGKKWLGAQNLHLDEDLDTRYKKKEIQENEFKRAWHCVFQTFNTPAYLLFIPGGHKLSMETMPFENTVCVEIGAWKTVLFHSKLPHAGALYYSDDLEPGAGAGAGAAGAGGAAAAAGDGTLDYGDNLEHGAVAGAVAAGAGAAAAAGDGDGDGDGNSAGDGAGDGNGDDAGDDASARARARAGAGGAAASSEGGGGGGGCGDGGAAASGESATSSEGGGGDGGAAASSDDDGYCPYIHKRAFVHTRLDSESTFPTGQLLIYPDERSGCSFLLESACEPSVAEHTSLRQTIDDGIKQKKKKREEITEKEREQLAQEKLAEARRNNRQNARRKPTAARKNAATAAASAAATRSATTPTAAASAAATIHDEGDVEMNALTTNIEEYAKTHLNLRRGDRGMLETACGKFVLNFKRRAEIDMEVNLIERARKMEAEREELTEESVKFEEERRVFRSEKLELKRKREEQEKTYKKKQKQLENETKENEEKFKARERRIQEAEADYEIKIRKWQFEMDKRYNLLADSGSGGSSAAIAAPPAAASATHADHTAVDPAPNLPDSLGQLDEDQK